MEYQDSHPERKNLVVISIGIIIFFFTDGKVIDKTIKIQAINVEFSDSNKIIYFIWLALIWALYRYWVVTRDEFSLA